MLKKRNPKCPKCFGFQTIKKGVRNGINRYLCKKCKKRFSVDHCQKEKVL